MTRACITAFALWTSCLSLAGCGGAAAPPTAPTPTPQPSASPTAPPSGHEFLYVGGRVYGIDPTTGTLQPASGSTPLGVRITGDPLHQYVYSAYGSGIVDHGGPDPWMVVYRPNPDGSLTALSKAYSPAVAWSSREGIGDWTVLRAGVDRVYGIWFTGTYHGAYYTYVTHRVDADGQLGPPEMEQFDEDEDWTSPMIDGVAGRVFRVRQDNTLTAYAVQPDGRLRSTGVTDLCIGTRVYVLEPLLAADRLVFGSTAPFGRYQPVTTCAWEPPRLASRSNLGFEATGAAAFVPAEPVIGVSEQIPTRWPQPLVAFESSDNDHGRATLRLVRLQGTDPELLDEVEAPMGMREMIFHPSGRFLYRMGCEGGELACNASLSVYAIADDGKLALVQTMELGDRPWERVSGCRLAIAAVR